MRKNISRLFAALLVVVLLCSMVPSAFAAGGIYEYMAIWDAYGLSESDYYAKRREGTLTPYGQLDVLYGRENEDGSYTVVDVPYIYREGATSFHNYVTGQDCAITSVEYDDFNDGYNLVLADGSKWQMYYREFRAFVDEEPENWSDDYFSAEIYYIREVGTTPDPGPVDPDPGPVDPDPGPVDPDPDPGDSGGVWSKLTDLIGVVLDGVIGIIESVFQKLFDALKALIGLLRDGIRSVVDSVLGIFTDVPALSAGFLDFLSLAFPLIPPEITTLLIFSIVAAVIVGIIKAIRK